MSGDREHLIECVRYFKDRPGFRRLMPALLRKWQSYGSSIGRIVLEKTTEEERETLGAFLGQTFLEPRIHINVRDVETALAATKFSGITLEKLLQAYFQINVETHQQEKQRLAGQKSAFFQKLLEQVSGRVAQWLEVMLRDHRHGYLLAIRAYQENQQQLQEMLENINLLEKKLTAGEKALRLAVASADVSGNPHYFDIAQTPGKLLVAFLSWNLGQDEPKNAEDRLDLYYRSGLRPDDMSSFTLLYGICLYTETGPHPASNAYNGLHEPFCVTLFNLENITRAEGLSKDVYIVENQTVFSDLCAWAGHKDIALMCTSGQVRTASLVVIDLLVKAGYLIHYSGDLDPEGLLIADRLIRRHPGCIVPWHMDGADYEASLSEEIIDEKRLRQLERIENAALKKVVPLLLATKRAGYQERLLERLKENLY